MAQIEFNKVDKKYDDFNALDNITFSIDQGEFVFIVGHSGAGKSTLIKMLIREEFPDAGSITFEGNNLQAVPYAELSMLRRKIGVVFQEFRLLESRTVYENVGIALEVVEATEEDVKNVVPNALNMVGLAKKSDNYPKHLSGGEKQRVSIARALAHEPKVLVLDEPTGMIDPDAAEEILKILYKINSLGTTIIMTTHNEQLVDKSKKRVIRLEKGKIVSDKKGGKYRA